MEKYFKIRKKLNNYQIQMHVIANDPMLAS